MSVKGLILYASYGDGHIQVSRVLKEHFNQLGVLIKMVDLFAESHPYINEWVRRFYIKSYSLVPGVYGLSYYMTKDMNHKNPMWQVFHSFGVQKMKTLLSVEQPDFVINTFPMLVMPELRRKGKTEITLYTVLTDFTLHKRWVHSEIDRYYVATEDLKTSIVEEGIPENKVVVSGIPIRPGFEYIGERREDLQQLGLDPNDKYVLVMAGAYGVLTDMKKICHSLLASGQKVVVVCGKNKELRNQLDKEFAGYDKIVIVGFIENIHVLMRFSMCIVTKPGGVTLAEALASEIPIILYRPAPGQERDNALYLMRKGVAQIVQQPEEITSFVKQLMGNTHMSEGICRRIEEIKGNHATKRIVLDILSQEQQKLRLDNGKR